MYIGGDPRITRKTRDEIRQELFMRKRSKKNNRKSSTMVVKHRNEADDGTNLIDEIGMLEEQFPTEGDDSGDDNETFLVANPENFRSKKCE